MKQTKEENIKTDWSFLGKLYFYTFIMVLVMFAFMIGFYWGEIQRSIITMNYCMIQNLTYG